MEDIFGNILIDCKKHRMDYIRKIRDELLKESDKLLLSDLCDNR